MSVLIHIYLIYLVFFVITYNFHGGNNEIYAENIFGLDEYYWKWGT